MIFITNVSYNENNLLIFISEISDFSLLKNHFNLNH